MEIDSFIKEEEKKLTDFLREKIILSKPEISQENFKRFYQFGFELHFLPKIKLTEKANYSLWKEKPSKIFYQLIKKEKLPKDAQILFGQWILIEKKPKPKKNCFWLSKNDLPTKILKIFNLDLKKYCQKIKKQKYPNDFLEGILKENGFSSRFSVSWFEIEEILKPEIARFLKTPQEKIRLPRFIEWNFLGNLFYPEWGKTETWEWFSDRLSTGECLSGGSNSLGICGWDPPDYWSTILGFRILIEI